MDRVETSGQSGQFSAQWCNRGASVMAGVGQGAVCYRLKWRFIVAAPWGAGYTHSRHCGGGHSAFEFISVYFSKKSPRRGQISLSSIPFTSASVMPWYLIVIRGLEAFGKNFEPDAVLGSLDIPERLAQGVSAVVAVQVH